MYVLETHIDNMYEYMYVMIYDFIHKWSQLV